MRLRITLAAVLFSTLLPAQQVGLSGDTWLKGRVADENSTPLSGVEIRAKQNGIERRTFSDPSGAFKLDLPQTGEYELFAALPGYFDVQQRKVSITTGANELALTLNRLRDHLESLDVSGASPLIDMDKTVQDQQLSTKELLEVPYRNNNDLRNAMRVLPGVIQDQNGGIHVNGASEQQVLYTLDGFNIGDPLTGTFQSRISVEGVQAMSVLSGAVPAEYGKGAAGVLTVNTRSGDDPLRYSATNFVPGVEYRKGLTIGSWNPRFNVSGPIRKGKVWFSNNLALQYIQDVIKGLPEGQDRSTSWRLSDSFRVQANLTPSNILSGGFLGNYWIAPDSGLSALDPQTTTVDRKATQWFFDVKDQIYLGHGSLVEFGYASNRTFGQQSPQGTGFYLYTPYGREGNYFVDGRQRSSRDQWLANYFLPTFTFVGGHQVKAGIDLDRVVYWQDFRRTGFIYYRPDSTPSRVVSFLGNGLFDQNNFESSAYLQDSWRVRPGLLLDLGLRTDRDTILRNWNTAPRAGFTWSPFGLEHTKISGGFGIIYSATNLQLFSRTQDQYPITTFYPQSGGPFSLISNFLVAGGKLRTPGFRNYNLGWEQHFATDWFTSVQAIGRSGRHGLSYVDTSGLAPDSRYVLQDARTDRYRALQFTVRQNLRRQYQWLLSYTRSVARSNSALDLNPDQPLIVGNNSGRLPWDAPNRILSWGLLPTFWKKWSIAYLAEWHSGFPFSVLDERGAVLGNVNSYRFPNFFEADLAVEREIDWFGQRWAWRAGLNNISNHHNFDLVNNQVDSPQFLNFYGNQGRSVSFRVRWLGKL